jgi:hypothetical protein
VDGAVVWPSPTLGDQSTVAVLHTQLQQARGKAKEEDKAGAAADDTRPHRHPLPGLAGGRAGLRRAARDIVAAPWRMRDSPPKLSPSWGSGPSPHGGATADRGGGRRDLRAASDGGGEGDGGVVGRGAAEQRSARSAAAAAPEIQPPPGTRGATQVGVGEGRERDQRMNGWGREEPEARRLVSFSQASSISSRVDFFS